MIIFGTGGIRGRLDSEFNEDVVIRASKALGRYILENSDVKRVVVAYDTRKKSKDFASLAASVLSGMGIESFVFENEAPTPVLSFACRYMNAFGIVITASHNPPEYNGYKVYTPDGVQAVPEVTSVISEFFSSEDGHFESGDFDIVPEEVEERYVEAVLEIVKPPKEERVKIAYTPLHGTGWRFVPRILKELGFDVVEVKEQMTPSGDFPTVEVPNPEEDDALCILKSYMKSTDIGLANDPDADRLGVLVKRGDEIVKLTGNQIGVLLTDFLTERGLPKNSVVIKTIVTTNMVKEMGKDRGFDVEETPTGFKFIGELVEKHERMKDKEFVFGFEESYGYLCGKHARDKDGISAAALVSTAFSSFDPLKRLEKLYKKYGYHFEKLLNFVFNDVDTAKSVYSKLKRNAVEFFGTSEVIDYSRGYGGVRPNETLKVVLDRGEVYLRPSGTEPKLKAYLMVVGKDSEEAFAKIVEIERVVKDVVSRARRES